MTCPDCTRAATNAVWAGYHASCHGCKVRALANGPQFWRSLQDRQRTPSYQGELVAVFGEEGAEAGHQAVFAEYKRLKKLRGGTP
jgi:hypothetical protein